MACPHFYDGYFGFIVDFQQGERHPDAVVEIAFGSRDFVFHRQDSLDEFFCSRLPVRSGQSDDRYRPAVYECHGPVPSGELLQSLQRVRNRDESGGNVRAAGRCLAGCFRIAVDYRMAGSGFKRPDCIGVPVEVFAFESEEKFTSFYL